jgi:hypothetical protein
VPDRWPDGVARWGWPDGGPDGAGRGARRVARWGWPDGVARRGRMGCPTGGQTRWPDRGPDGAGRGARRGLDRSHVIGHVIFECHVTRLGWQGVILLSTLLSQR